MVQRFSFPSLPLSFSPAHSASSTSCSQRRPRCRRKPCCCCLLLLPPPRPPHLLGKFSARSPLTTATTPSSTTRRSRPLPRRRPWRRSSTGTGRRGGERDDGAGSEGPTLPPPPRGRQLSSCFGCGDFHGRRGRRCRCWGPRGCRRTPWKPMSRSWRLLRGCSTCPILERTKRREERRMGVLLVRSPPLARSVNHAHHTFAF